MNEEKRKRLEAAGYWIGSAEDFLNNTEPLMDEARELLRELIEALDQSADASEHADDVAAMLRYGKAEAAARAFLSRPAAIVPPREPTREWLDNNLTFYDTAPNVTGPNVPALASVAKRIWYHTTDDQTNYQFSAVVDAAIAEGKQP